MEMNFNKYISFNTFFFEFFKNFNEKNDTRKNRKILTPKRFFFFPRKKHEMNKLKVNVNISLVLVEFLS